MVNYRLDNWVILKIALDDVTKHVILGGCSGGYLDADTWRMNSGIEKVEKIGLAFRILGTSGSTYEVPVAREGLALSFANIYEHFKTKYGDAVKIVPISDLITTGELQ